MTTIVFAQTPVDLDGFATKAAVDALAAAVTALSEQVAALAARPIGVEGVGVAKIWVGTPEAYAAVGEPAADTVYLIADAAA